VEGDRIHYLSAGLGRAFAASYEPTGAPHPALDGSLERFLVERYRLFAERRRKLITATVTHEPWPLQPAKAVIELNSMAPPGFPFQGPPLLHFSRSVSAKISAPEALRPGSVFGRATVACASSRRYAAPRPRRHARSGRLILRRR
jgi:uncharacterized protein YqjF (DUF2071 family)